MSFIKCGELTTAFQQLSWQPSEKTVKNCLGINEQFLCHVYGSTKRDLNELRAQLFKSSSSNSFRELPPSKQSLELHVQRSVYQAGWVWGNSISQEKHPLFTDCGWRIKNDQLFVK